MPIAITDILKKLSVTTGPGNTNAQADPDLSLGEFMSSTEAGETLHDLFDKVTGVENAASEAEYRCIFIHNNHGTLTAEAVRVWLSSEVAGGASIAIGVDTTVASAEDSVSAQALEVVNEDTAPAGVSFSSPTTDVGGIAMGDIPAGQCRALWVRRTTANTAALDADGVTLGIGWDTAE